MVASPVDSSSYSAFAPPASPTTPKQNERKQQSSSKIMFATFSKRGRRRHRGSTSSSASVASTSSSTTTGGANANATNTTNSTTTPLSASPSFDSVSTAGASSSAAPADRRTSTASIKTVKTSNKQTKTADEPSSPPTRDAAAPGTDIVDPSKKSPLGKHKLKHSASISPPPVYPSSHPHHQQPVYYPFEYDPAAAPYYNPAMASPPHHPHHHAHHPGAIANPYYLHPSDIAGYMMMNHHNNPNNHDPSQNFQRKKAKRQVAGAMVAGLWGNNNNGGGGSSLDGQTGVPITPPGASMHAPTAPPSHQHQTSGHGKKSTAKPRPVIEVPPRGIGPVYEPNHNDVLCGRGGRINAHAGNVVFREMVSTKKSHYLAPTTKKLEKAHIAAEIVREIRHKNPSGRFLKEDPDGSWFDIGDQKAIKKVGQALREDAPEVRDEIKKKGVDGEAHSSEDEKDKRSPKNTFTKAPDGSAPTSYKIGSNGQVISATPTEEASGEYRPIAAYELPQGPSSNGHHDYTVIPGPPANKPKKNSIMDIGMRGMMPKKPAAARGGGGAFSSRGGGGGGNPPYPHQHHHHQNNYRQPTTAVSGAAAQVMSQAQVDDAPLDTAFGRQFHVPETLHTSHNESSVISGMSGPTILSGMSGISALTDPQSTLSAAQRQGEGDLLHSLGQSPQHHAGGGHYSPYHQQRRGFQQYHQQQQQQQNYSSTYEAIRMSQLNQIRHQWATTTANGRNASVTTQDTPRSQQLIRQSDTGVSDLASSGNQAPTSSDRMGGGAHQRSMSWTDLGAAFENMSWADNNSLIGGGMSSQQHLPPPPPEAEYAGSALSGRSIASFNTLEDNANGLMLPPQPAEQPLAAVEMEAAAAAAASSGASVGGRTAGSSRSRNFGAQQRRYYGGGGASIKDGASVASMMSINSGNVSLGSVRSIMSDISENIQALDLAEPNIRLLDQFGAS